MRDRATSGDAKQLGEFLRAHRERRSPAEVGLPDHGRRRTPGLRREEVAALSGIGLAWYTWLEQGRVIPSRQVLEAVAATLGLRGAALRHVLVLGGLGERTSPDPEADAGFARSARCLLDAWERSPAVLLDPRFDVVAWNAAYRAVWSDPERIAVQRRNFMWCVVGDPVFRDRIAEWEDFARAVLGQFQAQTSRNGGDPRVQEVHRSLRADFPEFEAWWDCRGVGDLAVRKVSARIPGRGELELVCSALRPVEAPDHLVVVQAPVRAADRALVADLVAEVG
ncbi:helix-turn-helix transcriptional regulator [Saccharopolyspora cebuensis]|uniref:Helix-turn-helix domain-containing protein n=1 Tax=Saccharopolyspora cebuensis TaxID=418759 RepID=A0ABV4CQV9_9PSEU